MNRSYLFTALTVALAAAFSCKHEPARGPVQEVRPFKPAEPNTLPGYWEDPAIFEYGREAPRADFRVFESEPKALTNQYSGSEYHSSLNGFWKYRFFSGPDEVPAGIESSSSTNGWLDISMPGFAELKGLGKPVFKYFGLPFRLNYPKVPHDTNSVLILKKTVSIPESWNGRDVFAVLEGVSTSYFLYVNGALTGYNEDTKNTSEFLLNKFLKPGLNELTLVLIRYSDGSYLETHNQWSLTGLNRNAYLLARPRTRIRDFFAVTDFQGSTGYLKLDADITNANSVPEQVVVEVKILDEKTRMTLASAQSSSDISASTEKKVSLNLSLRNALAWSDEEPNSYDILVNIKKSDGSIIESAYAKTAFLSLDYKNGLAINGKRVLLKGVAAHEFHPINGNTLDKQWIDNDMDVMKMHNINAIRNNHYPFDSYWYESSLKYGLFIMEECNLDPAALLRSGTDLSADSSAAKSYMYRVRNTFERSKNHPNVVVWSLGHDCGTGINTQKAYSMIKARDKHRPVACLSGGQRLGDIDFNPGDPSQKSCAIAYTLGVNQGNSFGGVTTRWNKLASARNFAGGFIEDFTDQCFYMKNPKGQLFFGYGGVFGETQSDSFLCARGIFTSNKTPNPPVKIAADLYANFEIKPVDIEKGKFAITSHYRFLKSGEFNYFWTIDENGEKMQEGKFDKLSLKPGETKVVEVKLDQINRLPGKEYCVTLQVEKVVKVKGMFRFLTEKIEKMCLPVLPPSAPETSSLRPWTFQSSGDFMEFKRDQVVIRMDRKSGLIGSCLLGDMPILKSPLTPVFYRVPTDLDLIVNRTGEIRRWQRWWKEAVISPTDVDASDPNRIVAGFQASSSAIGGVKANLKYVFCATGDLLFELEMENADDGTTLPPRIAIMADIDSRMGSATWYGRGPYETYPDRKAGLHVGLYKSSVTDFNIPRIRPQEMSNKTDTRWAEISAFQGQRLCIMGRPVMDFKVLPFAEEDLDGRNSYGINVKSGINNHFIAGKEIWPMDDSPVNGLSWPQTQKLSLSLRLMLYQGDESRAAGIWSSGLP